MHSTAPEFLPQLGVHNITAWSEWKAFVNDVLNMYEPHISCALQAFIPARFAKQPASLADTDD